MTQPFLEVSDVSRSYGHPPKAILRNVAFSLPYGCCWGLLGESGSGKSTLARLLLGLEVPDTGHIRLEGQPLRHWRASHPGGMSVVFQDYVTSVPRHADVATIIAEGFPPGTRPDSAAIYALMDRMALPRMLSHRRPRQLSGGQLQRVCIARAIAARPAFLVLDEAISSLDVAVQARILELLHDLKGEMTCLFITHDIQAAVHLCDRLLFLHKGEIVASLPQEELFTDSNPHVRALVDSTLVFGEMTAPQQS